MFVELSGAVVAIAVLLLLGGGGTEGCFVEDASFLKAFLGEAAGVEGGGDGWEFGDVGDRNADFV